MKGLEISEIRLSEVANVTSSFRIDAEYYKKCDVVDLRRIERLHPTTLKRLTTKIDVGYVGTMVSEYSDTKSDPIVLQTRNIDEFIPNEVDLVHINEAFHRKLVKSQVHKEDVLIARSGSFGNAAVWLSDQIVNSSDIIIVGANRAVVLPCYLAAFLNSRFGRFQLERFASGAVQCHVNLTILENLQVPVFSRQLQTAIDEIVRRAFEKTQQRNSLYQDAETALLRELGFADWQPPTKTVSVRNCSDFMAAGRFDAEYFLPKYDELLKKLEAVQVRHLGGADGLAEFYKSEDPGSDCYGDEGVPFVRIADFSEFGIESVGVHIPPEVCADYRRPRKDTILLSKDGSVGIAYKVEEDLDVVTSGGILHLAVTDPAVLPDYLTLVLNSKIVRMQAERDAGGSIIQHWKPSEIAKVAIPILPMMQQREIVRKVQSSFAARKESKRLLEQAKRAVEVAIESGEAAGLAVLKDKGIAEKE